MRHLSPVASKLTDTPDEEVFVLADVSLPKPLDVS